jgi:hypothetical protein
MRARFFAAARFGLRDTEQAPRGDRQRRRIERLKLCV